jgi:hypothetical protein
MNRRSRQGDGQENCGEGKKRAKRRLHFEKEVSESRRIPAERKNTTREKIIVGK